MLAHCYELLFYTILVNDNIYLYLLLCKFDVCIIIWICTLVSIGPFRRLCVIMIIGNRLAFMVEFHIIYGRMVYLICMIVKLCYTFSSMNLFIVFSIWMSDMYFFSMSQEFLEIWA